MKKIIKIMMLMLALMLALVLASCGNGEVIGTGETTVKNEILGDGSSTISKASEGLEMIYREKCIVDGVEISAGYYVVGIGTCKDKEIIIPSEYQGKPVVAISCLDSSDITSVTVLGGVEYIAYRAFSEYFSECKNLESIRIYDGVKVIESAAFYGTKYYKNENNWENGALYIDSYLIRVKETTPNDFVIKNGTKIIAHDAFSGNDTITNITIPDGLINIGESAFALCKNLTTINIPDSVVNIGKKAFLYCENLTSIDIPDSVISIGDSAFDKCFKLSNVNLPKDLKNIGKATFRLCSSLVSVEIPDTVESIGDNAFYWCGKLENVKIGKNVKSIGESAFYECRNIIEIKLPDGITDIGSNAFEFCARLEDISIPDSVKSIGTCALRECTSIEKINFARIKAEWNSIDFGSDWDNFGYGGKKVPYSIICTDGTITVNQ